MFAITSINLYSGDIVAQRFKYLRDTFQKERKKILANPPSGACSENKRYEST